MHEALAGIEEGARWLRTIDLGRPGRARGRARPAAQGPEAAAALAPRGGGRHRRAHARSPSAPTAAAASLSRTRETSDVWLLDLEGGRPPERLTTGRDPAPYWEDVEPRLSPDGETVAYADEGHVWLVPTAGGPPRKLVEGSSPVWIRTTRLVICVERDDTTRLAVVDSADAWPRRLATGARRPRRTRRRGRGRGLARRHRGGLHVHAARRPQPQRDPRGRARRRRGARAHRHAAHARPLAGLVARTAPRSPTRSERSGFYELHLVGRDGAGERQLTSAGADHSEAEWHPDGERLVAVRGRRNRFDLVVVDADRGIGRGGRRGRDLEPTRTGPRRARSWRRYEDHATPPELRAVEPGGAAARVHAPAPAADPRRAPRRARGRDASRLRRARDPRLPHAPARRLGRPAGAGRRLPARRPDRCLRRRLGRPRAVLRRPRLRLARRQLPRLDRLRPRLRAR